MTADTDKPEDILIEMRAFEGASPISSFSRSTPVAPAVEPITSNLIPELSPISEPAVERVTIPRHMASKALEAGFYKYAHFLRQMDTPENAKSIDAGHKLLIGEVIPRLSTGEGLDLALQIVKKQISGLKPNEGLGPILFVDAYIHGVMDLLQLLGSDKETAWKPKLAAYLLPDQVRER